MIEAYGLEKNYGKTTAVAHLDFRVEKGEIVGFLGPNGAGKTTTLRMLSCFTPPTSGTARVAGFDVLRESIEVRRRIGYLPENVPLYDDMRVKEYLKYRGLLKGMGGRHLRMRLGDVMDACGVSAVRRSLIGTLSKGFRQRVGLADALLSAPDVLLLDEPTSGLDPNQMRQVRTFIRSLQGKHTILLSSHILSEVEAMCERVMIMNNGRIVAADSKERLAEFFKKSKRVVAEIFESAATIERVLQTNESMGETELCSVNGWTQLICRGYAPDFDIRASIFDTAVRNGWKLRELHEERYQLDDLFAAATMNAPPSETSEGNNES